MITDLFLSFLADIIKAAMQGLPSFNAAGWPSMPPPVADYLAAFGVVFGPGILLVLIWRVVAYFLPGGAG